MEEVISLPHSFPRILKTKVGLEASPASLSLCLGLWQKACLDGSLRDSHAVSRRVRVTLQGERARDVRCARSGLPLQVLAVDTWGLLKNEKADPERCKAKAAAKSHTWRKEKRRKKVREEGGEEQRKEHQDRGGWTHSSASQPFLGAQPRWAGSLLWRRLRTALAS